MTKAHAGVKARPSDDPSTCASCHAKISSKYVKALHFTTDGLRHGTLARFSSEEGKLFSEKVFPKACNSCHASCGDCHVKSPTIGGLTAGLLQGHRFVRRDEGKTCAVCHGGRVYPEFTGEYGGSADIHYEKGMMCVNCHPQEEFHGDGAAPSGRREVKKRPSCISCHPSGAEKTEKAKSAHATHAKKATCSACHSSAPYRNCYDCHLGKGAVSKPEFHLGMSPLEPGKLNTLRLIPTVRDTFSNAGVGMSNFDSLPTYHDTTPHNTRKRTDRTRSCDSCHIERSGYLKKEELPSGGPKANDSLIPPNESVKGAAK